jgi:DedD protein
LIGAAVLLALGIVGFPVLFETQPRPIAVDIPIEIPPREGAPPLSLPAPQPAAAAASKPVPTAAPERSTEAPTAAASTAVAAPASPPQRSEGPPPTAEREAERSSTQAIERKREAERARALLEGRPVPPLVAPPAPAPATAPQADAKPGRYVVQAGAYTDSSSLREARQKVEKLGLKTYTQVIETDAGARTRVRVGPFPTREEAEKAAARIKAAGLAVSILSL